MNLLNYLQNSPVIQWVILLLSALSLVLSLIYLINRLIWLRCSTLTKSQKTSLQNCLQTSENFLATILPSLAQALQTVLLNKNLLSTQNQNQAEQDPSQEPIQEPIQDQTLDLTKIIEFIKETYK